MKVIIAGSRTVKDYETVKSHIEASGFDITMVVSGCAYGVDRLGEQWADANKIPIERFPADWKDISHPDAVVKYGRNGQPYNAIAGHLRNEEMAKFADAVILIWDGVSTGTKDMHRRALAHNLEIYKETVNVEKITKEKAYKLQKGAAEWAYELREDKNALVLDTESCGGSKTDEIISIGVVRLHNGEVLMNTLLQPDDDVKFNWYATQVHGITKKQLAKAPRISDIHSELYSILNGNNVLAYNHSSDKRMIEQTLRKHELEIPQVNWHCIMAAYKKYALSGSSISLYNACQALNVKAGNHDAVEDALAAARLVFRISQEYKKK